MSTTPPAENPNDGRKNETPAAPTVAATPRRNREAYWLFAAVLGLLGLFGYLANKRSSPPTGGDLRVERLESHSGGAGLFACAAAGTPCQRLSLGALVPKGSLVKTDFTTTAVLALGAGKRVSLERGSEVLISSSENAKLERGSLLAELTPSSGQLVISFAQGKLSAKSSKFIARESGNATEVDVLRGSVELESESGRHDRARAGEAARVTRTTTEIGPAPQLGALSMAEDVAGTERAPRATRGLGELKAKKPGARDEITGAVRLASHSIRVRIAGAMVRTEIEEVFTNSSDQTLEGIYRFPIPAEAKLERLALDVDGKLVDGAFVDRDRAAAIWRGAIVNAAPQAKPPLEEIIWVPGPWRDPALLEWQRGGRFELRIFPIPRRGERRVILSYTELAPATGSTRRYTYPLGGVSEPISRFSIDVAVRGNDGDFGVHAGGYELARTVESGVTTLSRSDTDAKPAGDLSVEYALPNRDAELRAWSHLPTDSDAPGGAARDVEAAAAESAAYAAIVLKPRLPGARETAPLALAIVVDSSRSMFGESYARAKELAARLIREVDSDARITLLACDSACRVSREALEPGIVGERSARQFLDGVVPDGASDPTRAVRAAERALGELGRNETRVIYIGDGVATMGPMRPSHIEAEVARTLSAAGARLTAVAVGTEADSESLKALARGGGGVLVRYAPGASATQTAFAVLGATYGRALRDVTVTLPEGLYAVAPSKLDSIAAGGEALIVARMAGASVVGDVVLRGRIGNQAFERRYPLRLSPSRDSATLFVPRLYAGIRMDDLERDGSAEAKRDAVALSTRFNIGSRYTSLLVLESEAMFSAFGLDRSKNAAKWSGEEVADETASESEAARGDLTPPARDDSGPFAEPPPNAYGAAAPKKKAASAADSNFEREEEFLGASRGASAAAAPAPPAPAPAAARRPVDPVLRPDVPLEFEPRPNPFPRRRMVPMRRVWKRVGNVSSERLVPKAASFEALARAEHLSLSDADHRDPLRKLYSLQLLASDTEKAERTLERWLTRDPLDADALTARADLAARRGDREVAVRLLGSVIDAHPGDVAAQRRLERLERWRGNREVGCRYLIAAAESRSSDLKLVADAVRCSRASNDELAEHELVLAVSAGDRVRLEERLREPAAEDGALAGDLKLEATWTGGADLDLGIIDPEGRRISFLGAPTRAVISARDVTSRDREALALRGAAPGEYLVEIVRSEPGERTESGELTVTIAGTVRKIPFRLSGSRITIALVELRMVSQLVPAEFATPRDF
jgi:hypothetical protein